MKKMYEEEIGKSRCPIKVVERAGTKIKDILQKSYPFDKEKCSMRDCLICTSNGKGNCKKESITYEIKCNKCNYIYIGETSRNGYTRGREHLLALKKKDKESTLYKHLQIVHHNDKENTHRFTMNITGCHDTALTRQITEAVKINNAKHPLMNSKLEFGHHAIIRPTLTNFRTRDATPKARNEGKELCC